MQHDGRRVLARGWMLALAVFMAVACSEGAEQVAPDDSNPSGPTPGATAEGAGEPSPAPSAVTPAEYQQTLATLDDRLAAGFDDVGKLRKPVGLAEAVADLRNRVDEERAALAGVVPPETVADAHAELDVALSDLSADLTTLEADASSGAVCAGGAAVRRAGNGNGAAAVRQAAARLAEADPAEQFAVGTFVPKGESERNRRGRNGDLAAGSRGGVGELEIAGAPDHDAVLKLRVGDQGIRNVYVRKGTTVTVEDLPDGTYDVYAAQGVDWNESTGKFTRECSFTHFDDQLDFVTTATQYSVWNLELTETAFGNAPSSAVDPAEFPD